MDFGGQPNALERLVAVDGYCARKNAERMMVRKSGLFSQFGWHRGSNIVPKNRKTLFFGFYFIYKERRSMNEKAVFRWRQVCVEHQIEKNT